MVPSLGGNQNPGHPAPEGSCPTHFPLPMHFPKSWVSTWTVRMQFVTIRARGGAPGITLTGSRLLRTAPRAAQSPPKVPPSLSNSVVMSTEALGIIPNTPVHYRSERFEP